MRHSPAAKHSDRTYRQGLRAEWLATWFLRLRGWRIIAQRWRCPHGEIDLIAARGKQLAFIEVKARKTHEEGLYAIRAYQRARIARSAASWLATHSFYAAHQMRFDLVVVAGLWHIRHVPNAFDAGEI